MRIAEGIEAWINITPASTPERLKNFTKAKPTIGPTITLIIEYIRVSLNEKTLSFDNAMPKDIKTKNIVEYPIRKVAFSKNFGDGIWKYTNIKEINNAYNFLLKLAKDKYEIK